MQSQFLIDCRDVNKKIKRIIGAVCLLVLFVAYQTSITAFTHVHYVNGVLITHSHPFHGKHTHSKSELVVIGRLSTFQSPEVDVYEELHPMRMLLAMLEAEKLTSLVKEEWGRSFLFALRRHSRHNLLSSFQLGKLPVNIPKGTCRI